MRDETLQRIRAMLDACTENEKDLLFEQLRETRVIHEFERVIGAPAEMILDAVHSAPELTRRMLRGVIADAAFRRYPVERLKDLGWNDVTPLGNFAFDYKLDDGHGPITVQVKLQRSERGSPVIRTGQRYGFSGDIFIAETQKTRTGTDGEDNQTRPYRYGEFDVLAVSMQPSTGRWDKYMYTLGRWLLSGRNSDEMATIQPVAPQPNEFWTDDFVVAAQWFRTNDANKRMKIEQASTRRSKKSANTNRGLFDGLPL